MLEISKILSLSTAHITEKTKNDLCESILPARCFRGIWDAPIDLIVYNKGDEGFFIYVTTWDDDEEVQKSLTEDLVACIKFAREQDCDWLMFDNDVEPIEELEIYDR